MLSPLSKIINLEHIGQFKLIKDPQSIRVQDLWKKLIPAPLYNNFLTNRDIDKKIELQGDLLKAITNEIYNVDLAI